MPSLSSIQTSIRAESSTAASCKAGRSSNPSTKFSFQNSTPTAPLTSKCLSIRTRWYARYALPHKVLFSSLRLNLRTAQIVIVARIFQSITFLSRIGLLVTWGQTAQSRQLHSFRIFAWNLQERRSVWDRTAHEWVLDVQSPGLSECCWLGVCCQ